MPIAPGERFERYDVEALIGQGGMGEVYRATDTLLRRKVALKVLKAGVGGPEAVARLFREARAAAALSHPNTIAIHDLGETDGTVYIVMEYVSGKPLRSYVGDRSVKLETKLRWLVAIARALGAAHRSGVVHRDVKPTNVMITDDGGVKVLDFGLARKRDATDFKTQAGLVLGTPKYMAPEQKGGVDGDPLSDEYSFGVTAYEVLTGAHPGAASDAPIVPPDRVDPEIGAAVSAVVMRTLETDPSARFPTLDEAASALEGAAFGSMQVATIPERGEPTDTLRDMKHPRDAAVPSDVDTLEAPRTSANAQPPSTEPAPPPRDADPAPRRAAARTLVSAEAPPGVTAPTPTANAVRDATLKMPIAQGSGAPPPMGSTPPPAGAVATPFASDRPPARAPGAQVTPRTAGARSALPVVAGLAVVTALGAAAVFAAELKALVGVQGVASGAASASTSAGAAPVAPTTAAPPAATTSTTAVSPSSPAPAPVPTPAPASASAAASASASASASAAAPASPSAPVGDAAVPGLPFVVPSLIPSGLPLTLPSAMPVPTPKPPTRPAPTPAPTASAPRPARSAGDLAF